MKGVPSDPIKTLINIDAARANAAEFAARMVLRDIRAGRRKDGVLVPVTPRNKPDRNKPCPCGSGRKFKKCCLAKARGTYKRSDPTKAPKLKHFPAPVAPVETDTQAPADKDSTAIALLNAGVDQAIVWAYLETGIYMTEANKTSHKAEDVQRWEKALEDYKNATPEEQKIMLAPATEE